MAVKTQVLDGVPQEPGWYPALTISGWRPLRVVDSNGDLVVNTTMESVEQYDWGERMVMPGEEG